METLSKKEATDFFTDFYCGEHHIPNELKSHGSAGWEVSDTVPMATTDFDRLTKLVIMAHDRCIRVDIQPCGMNRYKIVLHKKDRSGELSLSHPTMEDSIIRIRGYKKCAKDDN